MMIIFDGCCLFRCESALTAFLQDTDPEATLSVGTDLRKIQLCFQLMKVCPTHFCYLLKDMQIRILQKFPEVFFATMVFWCLVANNMCKLIFALRFFQY